MTQLFQATVPSFVIATAGGASNSSTLSWKDGAFDADCLTVQAPATLDTGPYTWEGSLDGVTFATIKDLTGTAIKVPAATEIMIYWNIFSGLVSLRIHSAAATAASRTFLIMKSFRA